MTKKNFPLELLDTVTAITKPSFPIYNCVDYAAGTNEGYLIEVKRNMIVQNIYVAVTDIVELFSYYHWIGNDSYYYYVIRGASGLLVVIEKNVNCLKIVEKRDGVRNIRIRDPDNSGQPKIVLNDNTQVLTISKGTQLDDLENFDSNSHSFSTALSTKLQDLQGSFDGLAKENEMKRWLIAQHLESKLECGLEPLEPPSTATASATPPLTIINHFSKLSSCFWVLLLEIENSSNRLIQDLRVFPCHHFADEFNWHLDTGTAPTQQLVPHSKIYVTISARLPFFERERGVADFEVRYEKHILKTPKFGLKAVDIASGSLDPFQHFKHLDIDMVCLRVTHFTYSCNLKLTASALKHFLKLLRTEMGLKELQSCNEIGHYVGQSSAFHGLLIALSHHHDNQLVTIHAKNFVQLDIFKEALKDCVPDSSNLKFIEMQTPCII